MDSPAFRHSSCYGKLSKLWDACPILRNHWWMGYFMFCTFLRALETNKYNHITATYFLLAERILREKQEKEIQTRSASPSNIKAQFRWEFRNLNVREGFGVFVCFFNCLNENIKFLKYCFLESIKIIPTLLRKWQGNLKSVPKEASFHTS